MSDFDHELFLDMEPPAHSDFRTHYGSFGDAAAENRIAAAKAIASVGAAIGKNLLKIGFSLDQIARISSGQFLWSSASQTQIASEYAIKTIASSFAKWSTTWLKWADAGKRDDGTPYGWQRWFDFGAQLAEDARYVGGVSWDNSGFKAAVDAVKKTGEDIADPSGYPLWVKVLIGVGIAAAVAPVAGPFISRALATRSTR